MGKRWIILVFVVLFLCSACGGAGKEAARVEPTNTLPPIPTLTATLLPSLVPSATIPPTSTFTPSPTPSVTWTPLPTLAPAEAQARFKEWLVGSPECRLPCWAGITPGETVWQEALYILATTVEIGGVYKDYSCSFGPCNGFTWEAQFLLGISGSVATYGDNPVYGIDFMVEKSFDEISLDTFLLANGPPEKVYISTPSLYLFDAPHPFDIVLAYPEKKFVVRFIRYAEIQGDNIVSCGRVEASYFSIGWDEEGAWTEDRIMAATYFGGEEAVVHILPNIEDVTDMTIEEFYETLKADGDACISTPREYWP